MAEVQQNVPKSANTVTVGCKMPGGLLLQLTKGYEENEPVMGGGSRKVTVYRRDGEKVKLNGCAVPVGAPQPRHMIIGGYGLTPNVKADFINEWMRQNADSKLVKNNLVFIAASRDAAESKAEEQAAVKSGMEPLDPTFTVGKNGAVIPSDPRYPRSLNPNLTSPHTADRVA